MVPIAEPPAAAHATPIVGEAIEAPGPAGPPRGTLLGPTGGPVLLILPGSGPTDRDGNNPLGVRAAPYRLLAEGLAARGVASVRIDKRGLGGIATATPDGNDVTVDDYVRDTESWIAAIRARTGASCIWLLGHSEGGVIALAAAAKRHEALCGVILVSTPGRPLGEVFKGQLRANPANASLLDAADHAIDTLAKGGRVDVATLPPPLAPLFSVQVQRFEASIFGLDPAGSIRAVDRPILILQGDRDLQVGLADAERLHAAHAAATLVRLRDTNHVLKRVAADDPAANLATYADPSLPLAPGVVDAIAGFVEEHARAR
jgi:uncharacterized protein